MVYQEFLIPVVVILGYKASLQGWMIGAYVFDCVHETRGDDDYVVWKLMFWDHGPDIARNESVDLFPFRFVEHWRAVSRVVYRNDLGDV